MKYMLSITDETRTLIADYEVEAKDWQEAYKLLIEKMEYDI